MLARAPFGFALLSATTTCNKAAGGEGFDCWEGGEVRAIAAPQSDRCAASCRRTKSRLRYHQRMETNETTMYQLVGGDEKLRELVDRFYDLMDLEPEFAELRAMHPPSLDGSRDKLYHFLSGWTGGPDLYTPRYGNAFLRARHLPFPIGTTVRDQWLTCMVLAMRDMGFDEAKQDILLNAFFRTADWMRNKPD
jgi:hemoglobin